MASITVYGRLTRDPELLTFEKGQVAKIAVADGDYFRPKPGEDDSQSQYFDCEVWGGQAKVAMDFLRKGQRVFVTGQLVPNNYTSEKTGQIVKTSVVKANYFTLVESRTEGSPVGAASAAETKVRAGSFDSEIP